VTSRREPDRLAAEARRWLGRHRGPQTAATRAVREALDGYFADDDLDRVGRFRGWAAAGLVRASRAQTAEVS
jgi:hypothetical protein